MKLLVSSAEHLLVASSGRDQLIGKPIERAVALIARRRAGPEIHHDFGEILLRLELAEDHLDLTRNQLEQIQLLVEHLQDVLLQAASQTEVEHEHLTGLSDPVHASDPLLELHRIPRQIVIDHRPAELEVAALASDFARDEDVSVVFELFHRPIFLLGRQSTVERCDAEASLFERALQVIERRTETREHDRLVVVGSPQQVDQHLGLGRPAHALQGLPHLCDIVVWMDRLVTIECGAKRGRAAPGLHLQHAAVFLLWPHCNVVVARAPRNALVILLQLAANR